MYLFLFTIVRLTFIALKNIKRPAPKTPAIPVPDPHPEIISDGKALKKPIITDSPNVLQLPIKIDPN